MKNIFKITFENFMEYCISHVNYLYDAFLGLSFLDLKM